MYQPGNSIQNRTILIKQKDYGIITSIKANLINKV